MTPIDSAIIELRSGVFLTSECSGDSWGTTRDINKAHIMDLNYAEDTAKHLRSYISNRDARVIHLYARV